MAIRLDLHVHSMSHGKKFLDAETLENSIARANLDGVAITNFHDISHALELQQKIPGRIIIVGQEICSNQGHLLGLGLRQKIPDFLSAEETIKAIHRQNGLVIAPHPFVFLGIGKAINLPGIDAVETYNALAGRYFIFNYLAARAARAKKLPQVATSDTTDERFIGRSFTEIMADEALDVFNSIRNGKIRTFMRPLPIPAAFILKNMANFSNLDICPLHATPCVMCGKSIAVRLFRKRLKCIDCGQEDAVRILCSNGHYFCKKCMVKRIESRMAEAKS